MLLIEMKTISIPRLVVLSILASCSFMAASATAQEAEVAAVAAPVPAPNFGDYTSATMTTKAWQALMSKNYALVNAYTAKCIELFAAEAKNMQAGLTVPAPADTASTLWALNDVGTCYYVRGQAFEAQGMNAEAIVAYKKLAKEFSFAQTWDLKGWFWSPAEAAKQRLKVLEFDAL